MVDQASFPSFLFDIDNKRTFHERNHSVLCQWPNCMQVSSVPKAKNLIQNNYVIDQNSSIAIQPQSVTRRKGEKSSGRRNTNSGTQVSLQNVNNTERKQIKRITRLAIALDLDLNESPLLKFVKRMKVIKERISFPS